LEKRKKKKEALARETQHNNRGGKRLQVRGKEKEKQKNLKKVKSTLGRRTTEQASGGMG